MRHLDDAAAVLSTLQLDPMPKSRELALSVGDLLRQAEERWLARDDANPMLSLLRMNNKGSERKLRLFACACLRPCDNSLGRLRALDAAEAYADGLMSAEDLQASSRFEVPYPTTAGFAFSLTGMVPFGIDWATQSADGRPNAGVLLRCILATRPSRPSLAADRSVLALARGIMSNALRPDAILPMRWKNWVTDEALLATAVRLAPFCSAGRIST